MKILVIPDVHGETYWEKAKDLIDQYDQIIFLGDYLDAWDHLGITDKMMLDNLKNIVEFKKEFPNKVFLLRGNHEFSYINSYFSCSGYRNNAAHYFGQFMRENQEYFDMVHFIEPKYIFSHAGITSGWIKSFDDTDILTKCGDNLIDQLNNLYYTKDIICFGDVSRHRGGSEKYGSLIWADMQETATGGILKNFHQIVGHTPTKNKDTMLKIFAEHKSSILFCDCRKMIELDINDSNYFYKVIDDND